MTSVSGCWTVGSTAGGGRNFPSHGQNPHVPLVVTYDPGGTNVRVTLRQHSPMNTLHAIGFHIYKVRGLLHIAMMNIMRRLYCKT